MRQRFAVYGLLLLMMSPWTASANENWPNGPDQDPRDALPSDPGYIKYNEAGEITGGQWNLWSFVPESWAENNGFRAEEIAMGTGIHADRAWQRTTGDPRVIIAVLDSGIKWDERDLQTKHYLNRQELQNCAPQQTDPPAEDPWDINGDGVFNVQDYMVANPDFETQTDELGNQNGILDPGDLIQTCSDGVDDDSNGFTDDISGWDVMWNDNNPYDDTRYGHGTGEGRDSAAAGNDNRGDIGVCPDCTILNVRVGDSFVVDVNDFATGVIFAVDSGAHVVQEALGSINNTAYAIQAIEYAYLNGVGIIASAADELSFHHNVPGTNNHTIYVHAIVHDGQDAEKSTTFLNFNNCTNFGGQLLLSTPGGGCSSEATGISAGHAGLIYSAALQAELTPPLSSEELRGILIQSADDIDIPEAASDKTKFPSGPGWDWHFGYGRNNARTSVDMVLDDRIPPEADVTEPQWFEPIEVSQHPKVAILGRVGARVDGEQTRYDNYSWELEWAPGVAPTDGWEILSTGDGTVGGSEAATLGELDAVAAHAKIDDGSPLTDPHQYAITLRLRVTSQHEGEELYNEFRKTVHLFRDDSLLPGYPLYIGNSIESSPKVFDIDSDGKEEIVVASSDGHIHAWKEDGTEAPGWPARLNHRQEVQSDHPNILDICAFQADDNKAAHCATRGHVDVDEARETVMGTIAVGALNGDLSDLSIVALSFDGYAYVFDTSGQLREGWPQRTNPEHSAHTSPDATLDEGFFSAPVLYDLDGDGDLEIIAAAMDQYIYVWHHDGSPMAGWPLLVRDPLETQRARIISTPAVGDVDDDGFPEIAVGTNEIFGASGVENEARGYLLKHTGSPDPEDVLPALEEGWPVSPFGLTVNTLPLVGRGSPTNPAFADLDGDGDLEIHLDAIAFYPQLWHHDGSAYEVTMNNFNFGPKSDSEDAPAYALMNNATFARLDPGDSIDIIKGTAGFDFALTFAEGGIRAVFDHHLSAWDTETGNYLRAWPRVVDDWQFFMNPTVVDLDGDGLPEVLNGTGGYLLHAYNHEGTEPEGFPKFLGSWIIASPTFGDLTGNGRWDVVNMTRQGWVFAWSTAGETSTNIEWQTYAHDFHNTNNYAEPVAQYNNYLGEPLPEPEPEPKPEPEPEPETNAADDGSGCGTSATGRPTSAWLIVGLLAALAGLRRREQSLV